MYRQGHYALQWRANETTTQNKVGNADDSCMSWNGIIFHRAHGWIIWPSQRAANSDPDSVAEAIPQRYSDAGARAGTRSNSDGDTLKLQIVLKILMRNRRN